MATKAAQPGIQNWYHSPKVPMTAIRRFARQVARRFQPQRIILFGSYAYGRPHVDSDVDILVVMSAPDELAKALQIWNALAPPFAVDLIVRTPKRLAWRLKAGDSFLCDIVQRGKVLYEKAGGAMGPKDRSGLQRRRSAVAKPAPSI
jgi:predicted nucleotidyltransferase